MVAGLLALLVAALVPALAGGRLPHRTHQPTLRTDERVVPPPAGQSWSTSGQGEETLTSQMPLTAGTTQFDVFGLASGSSRHLKLSVSLTPQPSDCETHAAGEVSTEYGYDGHRRLTSVTRGTDVVGYTYRDSGERESITSPLGTVSYGYDGLERLHSVTGLAGTTTVEWEAGGERLLALTDGTLEERHCYDGRGWLTAVVNASSATSCSSLDSVTGLQSRFRYGYDGRGNRVSQEYLDGSLSSSEVTAYGYNGADWLTGVRYPDHHAVLYGLGGDGTRVGEKEVSGYVGSLGPGGFATAPNPTKDWTYGFDNQGGLLSATRPEVQPGGGETQVQVASWTTDAAGRVTHSVTPEGTRTFAWSARDTLAQATFTPVVPGGEGMPVTVSYGYDGDGLRRSRTVGGDSTGYLWAEGQLLEERLPGNDVLYANAAGMAVSANADRLAHDGLGSVVGLVGATTTTRRYDAWGGFLDGTVPTSVQPSLAYAGQAWDVDLGLSYAQQRWYDTATGRFLSTDPLGITAERLQNPIGLNVFLYGNGNPLRFTDPDGQCSRSIWGNFGYCLKEDIGYPIANAGIWAASQAHDFSESTKQDLGLAPLTEIKDAYSYYEPEQRRPELQQYDAFKAQWNRHLQGPAMQRTIDGQLVPVLETDEQRAARAHDRKVEEAIQGVNATAHVVLKASSVALDVDMALSGVGMLRGLGAGAFRSGALDAALDKSLAEEAAEADGMTLNSRGVSTSIALPRSPEPGETSTMEELLATGSVPGRKGVILDQRTVRYSDVWALSDQLGVEVSLARENVNGAKRFVLRSGSADSVFGTYFEQGNFPLAHTHLPGGPRPDLPSLADIAELGRLYEFELSLDPAAVRRQSRIVWGEKVEDFTLFGGASEANPPVKTR